MTVQELNGWTPRTVTLGPDGEVISVTVTQSRFSKAEVAILIASRRKEREPRGPHGWTISEATDPDNQFSFVVPNPITDHAQVALSAKQAEWVKKHPNTDPSTRLWRVEKRA